MKNYYLVLIEHFIGIAYLILFIIGVFTDNQSLYYVGGIGMLIFIFIMIKGQPKNLVSFLFMIGVGCIVAYFISKWWLGLFWISAFFTVGQLFGISALIKNKDQFRNLNQVSFENSNMKSNSDKIEFIEILFLIVLLFGPYLVANNLIKSSTDKDIYSPEKEIKEQVMHIEKSKEYSNRGIRLMNLSNSQVVSQNKIDSYKVF